MKVTGLMSIKELAELLGVSPDTARRAARSGLIPFKREGTAYRFDWPKVRHTMRARAEAMPYRRQEQRQARRAARAGRAQRNRPRLVTRGH